MRNAKIRNFRESLSFDIGDYIYAPDIYTTKKRITGFYLYSKDGVKKYRNKSLDFITGVIWANEHKACNLACGFIVYNEFTDEEENCHFDHCLREKA